MEFTRYGVVRLLLKSATGGRGLLAKRANRCHGLPLWRELLRSAQDAAASSLSSVNAAAAFRCARLLERQALRVIGA